MERIFISYKRVNKDQVFKLIEKIEQTLGVKCWYDLDGIESGATFPAWICTAIDNAEVVLIMHSSAHLGINFEEDWTVKELNYARATKKKVVLVRLDKAPLQNIFLLEFGTRNNIDSQDPTQWNKLMKDLRHWLKPPMPTNFSDAELEKLNRKGDEYYYKEKYSEAAECYRKAAEQGYAPAQDNLGWMYQHGYGVIESEILAVEWYLKAAKQGDANAQASLGFMYENGYGIKRDDTEATRWYRLAAEQGNDFAQYNLGIKYKFGFGVEKDLTLAKYWIQKAADQGNLFAKTELPGMK